MAKRHAAASRHTTDSSEQLQNRAASQSVIVREAADSRSRCEFLNEGDTLGMAGSSIMRSKALSASSCAEGPDFDVSYRRKKLSATI